MHKISFSNPNFATATSGNATYLNYIAKRDGVVLNDLGEARVRTMESDNDIYAKYIDERPYSHGLFDKNGAASLDHYKNRFIETNTDIVVNGVNVKKNTTIYRDIISLTRTDAQEFGLFDKDDFYRAFKENSDQYFKDLGMNPQKVEWCGAFHDEGHHPHMHIMFFEENSVYNINPVLEKSRLELAKENLTKSIAEGRYNRLISQKNSSKERVVASVYESLNQKESEKLFNSLAKEMNSGAYSGRANYKLLDPNLKKYVDRIFDKLITDPSFIEANTEYLNSLKELKNLFDSTGDSDEYFKSVDEVNLKIKNIIIDYGYMYAQHEKFKVAFDSETVENLLKQSRSRIDSFALSSEDKKQHAVSLASELSSSLGNLSNLDSKMKICDFVNHTLGQNITVSEIEDKIYKKANNFNDTISILSQIGYQDNDILGLLSGIEKPALYDTDVFLKYKELSDVDDLLIKAITENKKIDFIKAFKTVEDELHGFFSPISLQDYNRVLSKVEKSDTIFLSEKTQEILDSLTDKGFIEFKNGADVFTSLGSKFYESYTKNNLLVLDDEKKLLSISPLTVTILKETYAEHKLPVIKNLLGKLDNLKSRGIIDFDGENISLTKKAKNYFFLNSDSKVKTLLDRIDYLKEIGLIKEVNGNYLKGDNSEKFFEHKTQRILSTQKHFSEDIQKDIKLLDSKNGFWDEEVEIFLKERVVKKAIVDKKDFDISRYSKNTDIYKALITYTKLSLINGLYVSDIEKDVSKIVASIPYEYKIDPLELVKEVYDKEKIKLKHGIQPLISKTDFTSFKVIFKVSTDYKDLYKTKKSSFHNSFLSDIQRALNKHHREVERAKARQLFLADLPTPEYTSPFAVEIDTIIDF